MRQSEYQLPININSDYKFTESNYNNIKRHFIRIISERLSFFRVYGVMCPLLKKNIPTKTLLSFFDVTFSKDRKSIIIDYKKGAYENISYSTLVRSIDYGTLYTPPKRIFYPLFRYFKRNYCKFLNR